MAGIEVTGAMLSMTTKLAIKAMGKGVSMLSNALKRRSRNKYTKEDEQKMDSVIGSLFGDSNQSSVAANNAICFPNCIKKR